MGRQPAKRKQFEVTIGEKMDLWQYDSLEEALRASLPYLADLILHKNQAAEDTRQADSPAEARPLPDDQPTESHDTG